MTRKRDFSVVAVINGEIDARDNCYLGFTVLSIAAEQSRPGSIIVPRASIT